MTYEKAINVLNNTKIMILKGSGAELQEASQMAVEALEKQIPKKPIWERLGDSLSNADIIYMCPYCYKGIEEDEHHCECGQAILWEE